MTPEGFVEKWSRTELSERAASHEHFIDLCQLIDQPTPASADATGEDYCFEKPVKVVMSASKGSRGDGGFVDVWKRGCFAWEYKRKDKYKTLDDAYRQLYQYRDALDNPPLSIVSDIRTIEIRTHFPGYPTEKTVIRLEEVPAKLEVFRRAFVNPESFKPFKKSEEITADLAREFSDLAEVRREVLKLLPRFNVRATVAVRRKSVLAADAVELFKRGHKLGDHMIYDDLVKWLFYGLLDPRKHSLIAFAKRGKSDRLAALSSAISHATETEPANRRAVMTIYAEQPLQSAGLQVADYYMWIVQRLFERREDRFFKFLSDKFDYGFGRPAESSDRRMVHVEQSD